MHDSVVNYGDDTNPQMILTNHEEIAVAIAHGYAKATGKLGVAMVHDTVGLLHASNAIYGAYLDQAPVMIMGGTGPLATEKRRPWIDWIHTALVQGNAVRDFVKWDDQPNSVPAAIDSTNWKTSSNTSAGSRLRVFVSVEWSGLDSSSAIPRKYRRPRLSAHRQAMPRWLSMPSK